MLAFEKQAQGCVKTAAVTTLVFQNAAQVDRFFQRLIRLGTGVQSTGDLSVAFHTVKVDGTGFQIMREEQRKGV